MKIKPLCFLVCCLLFSCQQSSTDSEDASGSNSKTSLHANGNSAVAGIQLACLPPPKKLSSLTNFLHVVVGKNKYPVAQVATCINILSNQYATYQIPASAIQAMLGRTTEGDYCFFLQPGPDGGYQLLQGSKPSTSTHFEYKIVASINREAEYIPAFGLTETEGVYLLNEGDKLLLFVIFKNAGTIKAILYELEDEVTKNTNLKAVFSSAKTTILKHFLISPYDHSFTSELGKGQISGQAGSYQLTFFDLATKPLSFHFHPQYSAELKAMENRK